MGQYAVIGLGSFGFHMAKKLGENGQEVVAIDANRGIVDDVKDFVTAAVVTDATDRDNLTQLITKDIDVAIVSLGDKIEASVMVTLYLREIGVKRIITKALTPDHGKVLKMVGATDVIYPEKDMAEKLASNLSNPNVLDYLPLSSGHSIREIAVPKAFEGKSLAELHLRKRFQIQVIAIRSSGTINLVPAADYTFKAMDTVILVGPNESLEKIVEAKE